MIRPQNIRLNLCVAGILILQASVVLAEKIPAEVTINPAETFQEIDGFGTCIVNYDMLPSYQKSDFYDRAVFDLGMSILRLPIGGIEADKNDNDDAGSINWENVQPESIQNVMEIAQQFKARGIRYIMATPWSPPAWMKTNRSITTGGRLRPDLRSEFAEYLEIWTQAAERFFGLQINAVSIQNEPLFTQTFASCVYNPIQIAETFEVVRDRFSRELPQTELIVSEDMGWADRFSLYLEPLMAKPESRNFKGFFASHGWNGINNWRRMHDMLKPYGHKLWMTETSGHPPDWPGALALAENIHDTLAGGNVSAFIYWQIDAGEPSRWALLNNGEYTPKAYAMQHFSRLVRPGSVRVHAFCAEDSLLVSAYHNLSTGLLTVVLVNPASKSFRTKVSLADKIQPYNWLCFSSREGDYFRESSVSGDSDFEIPPFSVVSLVGRPGQRLTTLQPLKPENWKQPDLGPHLKMDPDSPAAEGLHAAARSNDIKILKSLLEEGMDPDQLNIGGLSPLHRAAWPGHVEAANILLEMGADPNVEDSTGGSPIQIAVLNGRDDFIRTLVAGGAEINHQDNQGVSALSRAAQNGHTKTVQTLLELGADPTITDEQGWTTLHWAASCPSLNAIAIMDFLLHAGVDPNATDRKGLTPLHVAAMNLVNPWSGGPSSSLDLFVNVRRLQTLVEAGANVNAPDLSGRTPLHWVAWLGETQYGEDKGGRPYFRYRTEAIQYLLSAGADPQSRDNLGKLAVDYAQEEGYQEAAIYLRKSNEIPWMDHDSTNENSNPDHPSQQDFRLNQEILSGNYSRVRELLEAGLNPNLPAPDGKFPLHVAVMEGNPEMVRLLLDAGADPGIRDTDGYQPIDRAIQNHQSEMVKLLRQYVGSP